MKLSRLPFFAALLSFLTAASLEAQPRRSGILVRPRPHFHVVHATPRVVMDVRATTRLADRRTVAPVYLSDRDHLTGHHYARMADLHRVWAEAEFDSFAADPLCPLVRKSIGRGEVYVRRVLTAQFALCSPTTAS